MRRSSFTPVFNLSTQEPLIVVEETQTAECAGEVQGAVGGVHAAASATATIKYTNTSDDSDGLNSPKNPHLLCPFPDMQQRRKHSLPSLQITEGILASQVRRLSDVGGETATLNPHDVEFLTTLSQKANSTTEGRRHSVVTISAASSPMFGRNRHESISGASCSRRGSGFQRPPLTDPRSSTHNLQLDIMDGIVQIRKGRSGSGVWTAPLLKETESNVPLQA